MSDITSEDKKLIVDGFRRLMREHCSEEQVRQAMAAPNGYDSELWQQLADMGVLGLLVDSKWGGTGASLDLLVELVEEMGASLYCGPYLSTAVWAVSLLQACTNEDIKQRLLPELISGEKIIAIAATGSKGLWTEEDVSVVAEQSTHKDTWRLTGTASFVLHYESADTVFVIASTEDNGVGVFEVDPKQRYVAASALPVNDPSLRVSKIEFNGCQARILDGLTQTDVNEAMNTVRLALAAEHAGGARRMFDITVEYLKTRYQFGRPIGSYQALKHMAADLLIEVESSTTVVRSAAQAAAQQGRIDKSLLYLAAFTCADVFREVTAQSIQMHGGIAYTKEHCAHLYWRRARSGQHLFGSSDSFRELYLQCWEEVA